MENPSDKEKYFVTDGAVIKQLEVISRVYDVLHHPAYPETKKSYLVQGRLWDCLCSCGKIVLLPEFSLARGSHRSCGCAKLAGKHSTDEQKQKSLQLKLQRLEINTKIKRLRIEMKYEQLKDVIIRNEKKIEDISAELRSAYAKKASLAAQYHPNGSRKRKISNPEKIDRLEQMGVLPDFEARALKQAAREIEKQTGVAPSWINK